MATHTRTHTRDTVEGWGHGKDENEPPLRYLPDNGSPVEAEKTVCPGEQRRSLAKVCQRTYTHAAGFHTGEGRGRGMYDLFTTSLPSQSNLH